MSNVIPLKAPAPAQSAPQKHQVLIGNIAQHRRQLDDVFWLKENAELLNILDCTGAKLTTQALAPLDGFYQQIENRIGFFQQYYRFILSICLDLEDLGMPGTKGEALAHWVARQGLPEGELSDLQRAEALRLLARRNVAVTVDSAALVERLHRFINRSQTFALPNKKAAYELTHIVFYLSEYGRQDPGLDQAALTSLEFAGILAYLDQNSDLLAEVCIALRYAGQTPSPVWESWLQYQAQGFILSARPVAPDQDGYHDFFVCNWAMATAGRHSFVQQVAPGAMAVTTQARRAGPLRQISRMMYDLHGARSPDWVVMRAQLQAGLSEEGHDILCAAEGSSRHFEHFFAGFARAEMAGAG